jgi:PhnB protein
MAEKAPKPVPDGMNNVTASLWFNGNCAEAIDYYKKIFDAKTEFPPYMYPDGKNVMHAMIKIGDTNLMMGDSLEKDYEKGPQSYATASFWLYVEDCDAVWDKALANDCEIREEMMDTFWGDRMGKVKDPFGHSWNIASLKFIVPEEELKQKEKEWRENI